jgi:hypothetical protein
MPEQVRAAGCHTANWFFAHREGRAGGIEPANAMLLAFNFLHSSDHTAWQEGLPSPLVGEGGPM